MGSNKQVNRRGFLASLCAGAAALGLKANPALAAFGAPHPSIAPTPKANTDADMFIAFGSCNRQWDEGKHWAAISALDPQLWIWLGDNIYSDGISKDLRQLSYNMVTYNQHYIPFKLKTPIIGTWDDHDFGLNDAGAELPIKDETQQQMLDFFDIPVTDPLRAQAGIYHTNVFEQNGRWIKIILLDLRYFRDITTPDGQLVGEAQWKWFEREIAEPGKAELILIGSSSQCVADVSDNDGWDKYPTERERLFKLLATSVPPVVIISGDTHWAGISRVPLANAASGQKWLYDFTSSGLTHFDKYNGQTNLVSPILEDMNFGTIRIQFKAGSPTPNVIFEIRKIDGSIFHSTAADLN